MTGMTATEILTVLFDDFVYALAKFGWGTQCIPFP